MYLHLSKEASHFYYINGKLKNKNIIKVLTVVVYATFFLNFTLTHAEKKFN